MSARGVASGLSLLIVEPDALAAQRVAGALRADGLAERVEWVKTLREGATALAERGFDLVLLALATADAEGVEGIARIRALDPEVPVVATSEDDDETLAVQALQRGAQECLSGADLDARSAPRLLRHAVERQRILLELRAAREREQYLATHDHLTGIPNRALFYDRLAQAIAQASRYGKTLAVLFVDLDAFKPVNDTLGHAAGDRLLQTVAQRLAAAVRRSDSVARIGGDEFGLVLTQVERASDAAGVAENLLRRIAEPVELGHAVRRIRASIGISIYPNDGELADTLVRNADTAMYRAKQADAGGYAFFQPRTGRPADGG